MATAKQMEFGLLELYYNTLCEKMRDEGREPGFTLDLLQYSYRICKVVSALLMLQMATNFNHTAVNVLNDEATISKLKEFSRGHTEMTKKITTEAIQFLIEVERSTRSENISDL